MFRPMVAIFRLSWQYLRATVSYIAHNVEISKCLVSRYDKAQIKQTENKSQIKSNPKWTLEWMEK